MIVALSSRCLTLVVVGLCGGGGGTWQRSAEEIEKNWREDSPASFHSLKPWIWGSIHVNVTVHSCFSLCGPAMSSQLIQGYDCLRGKNIVHCSFLCKYNFFNKKFYWRRREKVQDSLSFKLEVYCGGVVVLTTIPNPQPYQHVSSCWTATVKLD